ncbi:SHOCT domain-containing protein [Halobacterium yunchengense]|uniref:SHOCT domain-containing protein n=1 Tax=Halobacterium yunchengense TaxID=3108497 RepID=UPI003009FCBF
MAQSDSDLLRVVVVLLAAFVLLPALAMALFVPMAGTMGWMSGGHVGAARSPLWLAMPLFWVVLVAALGYLAYRAVAGGGSDRGEDRDPALEELRSAYARGDITDEEYERRRERLREE